MARRLFRAAGPLLLVLAATAAAPEDAAYRLDPTWPAALPNDWLVGDVTGVAVDRHDHIWILHRPRTISPFDVQAKGQPPAKCCVAAPPVIELDGEGRVLRAWGGEGTSPDWFDSEHSIFVDAEDNVWLLGAGATDGAVLKFTPDGRQLLRIGRKGSYGAADDPTMLGKPTDLYVDTVRREVYVSDGYRNRRVIVFDADTGAFKRQWTAFGRKVDPASLTDRSDYSQAYSGAPDRFTTVHCVTRVGEEIFVCDRTNDRLQVFTPEGRYLRELHFNRGNAGKIGSTWDAAPLPGRADRILILDGSNSEVAVVDTRTGAVLASYRAKGRYGGQMHWPHQIAADAQHRIYVGEVDHGGRIQRFVPVAKNAR